jgi:hypothetical protein
MSTLLNRTCDATGRGITAWECIGCGRIEAAQPCIGICQDRRIELVRAADYNETVSQLSALRVRMEELDALARQLARTTPRPGFWEHTYRVLQSRARALLAEGAAAQAGAPAADQSKMGKRPAA